MDQRARARLAMCYYDLARQLAARLMDQNPERIGAQTCLDLAVALAYLDEEDRSHMLPVACPRTVACPNCATQYRHRLCHFRRD